MVNSALLALLLLYKAGTKSLPCTPDCVLGAAVGGSRCRTSSPLLYRLGGTADPADPIGLVAGNLRGCSRLPISLPVLSGDPERVGAERDDVRMAGGNWER